MSPRPPQGMHASHQPRSALMRSESFGMTPLHQRAGHSHSSHHKATTPHADVGPPVAAGSDSDASTSAQSISDSDAPESDSLDGHDSADRALRVRHGVRPVSAGAAGRIRQRNTVCVRIVVAGAAEVRHLANSSLAEKRLAGNGLGATIGGVDLAARLRRPSRGAGRPSSMREAPPLEATGSMPLAHSPPGATEAAAVVAPASPRAAPFNPGLVLHMPRRNNARWLALAAAQRARSLPGPTAARVLSVGTGSPLQRSLLLPMGVRRADGSLMHPAERVDSVPAGEELLIELGAQYALESSGGPTKAAWNGEAFAMSSHARHRVKLQQMHEARERKAQRDEEQRKRDDEDRKKFAAMSRMLCGVDVHDTGAVLKAMNGDWENIRVSMVSSDPEVQRRIKLVFVENFVELTDVSLWPPAISPDISSVAAADRLWCSYSSTTLVQTTVTERTRCRMWSGTTSCDGSTREQSASLARIGQAVQQKCSTRSTKQNLTRQYSSKQMPDAGFPATMLTH